MGGLMWYAAIFGGGAREETSGFSRIIYAVVGLAGLAAIPMLFSRRATVVQRHATA